MKPNEQKASPNAIKFLQAVKYKKKEAALQILASGEKVVDLLAARDSGITSYKSSGWSALHWVLHYDDIQLLEKIVSKLTANELAEVLQFRTNEPWRLLFGRETIFGYEYRKKLGFNGIQTPLHFVQSKEALQILEVTFNRKFSTPQMSNKLDGILELKDALDNTAGIEYSTSAKKGSAQIYHETAAQARQHHSEEEKYYDANLKDVVREFLDGHLIKAGKVALKSLVVGSLKKVEDNPKKKLFLNVLDILLEKGENDLKNMEAISKAEKIASGIIASGLDIASLDKAKLLVLIEAQMEAKMTSSPKLAAG